MRRATGAYTIVCKDSEHRPTPGHARAIGFPAASEIDAAAITRSRELLAEDRSERFDSASGPVFIQVFNPPCKLILVGAVHIAQALARLGALAGYEILIIDPRGAHAEAEGFADQSHMTATFRKFLGATPKAFRAAQACTMPREISQDLCRARDYHGP